MMRGHVLRSIASVLVCVAALAPGPVAAQTTAGSGVRVISPACQTIVFFHREGCPYCARAHVFLDALQQEHPELEVDRFDIRRDPDARDRFFVLSTTHGIARPSVPAFLICGEFSVGFDRAETSGALIRDRLAGGTVSLDQQISGLTGGRIATVSVDRIGLPLFTVAIGLIDGFNPCAMWVLLFLLSMLVGVTSRRRTVLIAGTFVAVSGLMYFAFMAAWLNAFLFVGVSRSLQMVLGVVALTMGAIHMKDFFAFKRGITLSIPERIHPTLFARLRSVVTTRSLLASVVGVALLAALVNVVEFLCTAGLPAVYTQILTLRSLTPLQYYGYLALYNLAYVFDDALMVTVAVATLHRWKMQERHGRWLKLVSGVTIATLGGLLVFAPHLLV